MEPGHVATLVITIFLAVLALIGFVMHCCKALNKARRRSYRAKLTKKKRKRKDKRDLLIPHSGPPRIDDYISRLSQLPKNDSSIGRQTDKTSKKLLAPSDSLIKIDEASTVEDYSDPSRVFPDGRRYSSACVSETSTTSRPRIDFRDYSFIVSQQISRLIKERRREMKDAFFPQASDQVDSETSEEYSEESTSYSDLQKSTTGFCDVISNCIQSATSPSSSSATYTDSRMSGYTTSESTEYEDINKVNENSAEKEKTAFTEESNTLVKVSSEIIKDLAEKRQKFIDNQIAHVVSRESII